MELHELKNALKKDNLQNLYLFFGPETVLIDQYVSEIVRRSKKKLFRLDTVAEVFTKLRSGSILSKNGCVYFVRDDKNYTSAEKAWKTLIELNDTNIVILVYSSLDKRTKFYNEHKKIGVEFEKISVEVLASTISKKYGMDTDRATRLANRCNNDYGRILLEIDKLDRISRIYKMSIDKAYDKAVEDELIPIWADNIINDFVSCVACNDYEGAWFLMRLLRQNNEPDLKVIAYLYNTLKTIFLVQSCGKNDNVYEKTGLSKWIVDQVHDQVGYYPNSSIINMLNLLRETEVGIKTGGVESEIALEKCLVNMCFCAN